MWRHAPKMSLRPDLVTLALAVVVPGMAISSGAQADPAGEDERALLSLKGASVAVFPLENLTNEAEAGRLLTRELYVECRRSGWFSLVSEETVAEAMKKPAGAEEKRSLEELAETAETLEAEGLLWGRVHSYRPGQRGVGLFSKFTPALVDFEILILSVEDGRVLWEKRVRFDMGDRATVKCWVDFLNRFGLRDFRRIITSFGNLEDDYRLGAVEVDMAKFRRFACHEVLRAIPLP